MSAKLDLTGQRFGKLIILEQSEHIGNRVAWRCLCDCGKETIVTTNNLRSGTTRSCGCLLAEVSKMQRIDMTGERFGKLTVLAPSENIGQRTAWICKCDCGNVVAVTSNKLRSGHTKSCGCKKTMPKVDLTGQRFGMLTVLRRSENIGRYTAWHCQCDCGTETVVMAKNLRNGGTKSCGCQMGGKRKSLIGKDDLKQISIECYHSNKFSPKTSGGVIWDTDTNLWVAYIFYGGKQHNLGRYHYMADAEKALKCAEKLHIKN